MNVVDQRTIAKLQTPVGSTCPPTVMVGAPDAVYVSQSQTCDAYGGPAEVVRVTSDGKVTHVADDPGNVFVGRAVRDPHDGTLYWISTGHGGICGNTSKIVAVDTTGRVAELPVPPGKHDAADFDLGPDRRLYASFVPQLNCANGNPLDNSSPQVLDPELVVLQGSSRRATGRRALNASGSRGFTLARTGGVSVDEAGPSMEAPSGLNLYSDVELDQHLDGPVVGVAWDPNSRVSSRR